MKKAAAFFISVVLVLTMLSSVVFADEDYVTETMAEEDVDALEEMESIEEVPPIDEETDNYGVDSEFIEIEPETIIVDEETAVVEPDEVGDNDELLMAYMEISASTSNAPMYSFNGLRKLTGINAQVYGLIRTCAKKVANGEETSTIFTFSMSDLGLDGNYSAADLGVDAVVENNSITPESQDALAAKLQDINLSRVITALLFDCPADFYWYEKSVGCNMQSSLSMGAEYDPSLDEYVLYFSDDAYVSFSFTVAEDYAINNASGTYIVDSSVSGSIQTALAFAQEIISSHANETDYQKLVSYKEAICGEVTYNSDAGNHNYTYNYGNPWQLIWVFDQDASTNVVCEGYSKAFQFLCDGSEFDNERIESRIVTGTMTGGTGAGGHMWNVVTMGDGNNYLVDVTNSDIGTVGQNSNMLFLAGYDLVDIIVASGEDQKMYDHTVYTVNSIVYEYDDATTLTYDESELVLSNEDYWEETGEGTFTEGNYTYSVKNGCATIVSYSGSEKNIITPQTLGGYPVKTIANQAFSINYEAESLTISPGIESIEYEGVIGCYHQISLPKTVIDLSTGDVGDFFNVGMGAFSVTGLKTIILDEENPAYSLYDGALYTKDLSCLLLFPKEETQETIVLPEGLKVISPESCSGITSVKKIVMPNSVIFIGNWAFQGCYNLEEINISSSCEEIGQYAFCSTAIRTLFLPASLKKDSIGGASFELADNLECLEVDENSVDYCSVDGALYSLKEGKPDALICCPRSKTGELIIPNTVTQIKARSLIRTLLDSIQVPASVVYYDSYNFIEYKPGLTIVGLTYSSAESMAEEFGLNFQSIGELEEIVVDSGIINDNIFWNYTNTRKLTVSGIGDIPYFPDGRPWQKYYKEIQTVVIEEGIVSIGDYTFVGYSSINSVSLPSTLKYIGIDAFSGTRLKELTIPEGVRTIGEYAFHDCDALTEVFIPSSVESIGVKAFANDNNLLSISVNDGNNDYSSLDGVLFNKEQTILVQFPLGREGTYTVPDTVQVIGYDSFELSKIEVLYLNEGLKTIEDEALAQIRVKSIIIPSSVESIGSRALCFCNNLKRVVFLGSAPQLGSLVFADRKYDVYYPENDTSWTSQIRQDYGGYTKWIAYNPETTRFITNDESLEQINTEVSQEGLTEVSLFLTENTIVSKSFNIIGKLIIPKGIVLSVNTGAVLESAIENYGHLMVNSGAVLLTPESASIAISNSGEISLMHGSELHSQNKGIIENTSEGKIYLDGSFYCGCFNENGLDQTVLNNQGFIAGYGTIYLYEVDPINAPVSDMNSMVETIKNETSSDYGISVELRCNHEYGDIIAEKPATCVEDGMAFHYECRLCHKLFIKEGDNYLEKELEDLTLPAKGHTWNTEYTVDKEATCTEEGSQSIHCSVCGEVQSGSEIMIPMKEHTYGDWVVTQEATCTATGSKEKTCSVCGDIVTETIPAKGHVWNEEYTVDREATCTEAGSESKHCAVCDAIDETTVRGIPAKGHKYGDWVVTKEATCTSTGTREKVCSVCNDKVTETIPAKGHTWEEEYTVDKEATCTEAGSESKHCAVCDAIDETTVRGIPAKGHKYGEWAVTEEAACTTAGSREKVCSICNDKVTETIPAKGHTWKEEYTVDKEATCTEAGSESRHCAVCDAIDETTVRGIPAKGHSYGEWNVTKEATCTEEGTREKVCKGCGDKVIETIQAKGHTYGDWVVTKEPTFTEDGQKEKVCTVCGDKITGIIPKLIPAEGWNTINGKRYYYVNGDMKTGWHKEDGKWYYLDPSEDGAMATGKINDGNAYYFMNADGVMLTGWIKSGDNWYFANPSGALATGWVQSGSTWYYLNLDTCIMATGWVKSGSAWYYMNPSGAMATGWVKDGDTWYYMNSSGAMVTGWVKVGNTWYFMKSSGAMAASEWVTGYYWISASGAWTYQPIGSWKKNDTGWWFGDTSGWYAKNETLVISGVEYTFNAAGYWEE